VAATSVEHATTLMAEQRPIAILLHAHLGEQSTRDTVSALHAGAPSTALILYSGRPGTHEELVNAVPGDWVRAYLQKPFDVDQVTGVLDAVRNIG
jgi:DNA-binding NtrC family response regulator